MDGKLGFRLNMHDLVNTSLPTKHELALELVDKPNEPACLCEIRLHIPNADTAEELNEKI
jgi:hypothetical protein